MIDGTFVLTNSIQLSAFDYIPEGATGVIIQMGAEYIRLLFDQIHPSLMSLWDNGLIPAEYLGRELILDRYDTDPAILAAIAHHSPASTLYRGTAPCQNTAVVPPKLIYANCT